MSLETLTRLKRLSALATLIRLRYTAQIVAIVAIFSITNHGVTIPSLSAIISSLLLSISIFCFDEAHDLKTDQVVHPNRPIPKGLITVRQAYLSGIIFLMIGIFLSSTLFLYQFVIFIVSSIIAIVIIFSNIKSIMRAFLNAFLIWTLFPFSAYLDLKTVLFGLIVSFPHFGGSIAKDFIHYPGDKIQNLESPPVWAKYLVSISFFLASAIVFLPKLLNLVSWYYMPPIIFTNISCLILGFYVLKERYDKVYFYGGIGMVSALIAFLLGGT